MGIVDSDSKINRGAASDRSGSHLLPTTTMAALLQRNQGKNLSSVTLVHDRIGGANASYSPMPPSESSLSSSDLQHHPHTEPRKVQGAAAAAAEEDSTLLPERSHQTLSANTSMLEAEFSSRTSLVLGPDITPLRSHVKDILGIVDVWPAGSAATGVGSTGSGSVTANEGRGRNVMRDNAARSAKPVLLQRLEEYVERQLQRLGRDIAKIPHRPDVQDALDLVLESDEFSEERLEIFRNVFEELSLHFQTYRRLLCVIRKEYELAIHHARLQGETENESKSLFSAGFVERLQSELKKQVQRAEMQKARLTELDEYCQRQAASLKENRKKIETLTKDIQSLTQNLEITKRDLEIAEEKSRDLIGADEVRQSLEKRLEDAIQQRNMGYERETQLAKMVKSMVPMEKLEAAYGVISRLRAESTISLLSRRMGNDSFGSLISFVESVMSKSGAGPKSSQKLIMDFMNDSMPSLQKIVEYADLDGLLAGKTDYLTLSRIMENSDWDSLRRMLESSKVERVQQAIGEELDPEQIVHLLLGSMRERMGHDKATKDSMLQSIGDTSMLDKDEILELRSLLKSMNPKSILQVLRGKMQKTIIGSRDLQVYFAQAPILLGSGGLEKDNSSLPESTVILDQVRSKYSKLELEFQALQKRIEELVPVEEEEEAEVEEAKPDDASQRSKEKFWKSPGVGASVPKYLRFNGKIRNRNLSKAVCEAMVKEVWREKAKKDHDTPMEQFFYLFLQKKFGIQAMVAEWGLNMIDALERYSYDNDCEIFLKVLQGELAEEVYHGQMKMLDDLQSHLQQVDMLSGGKLSGKLAKKDFLESLQEFFSSIGAEKAPEQLKEIKKALEKDQPGGWVMYDELFKEDREGNQGEFAEKIRDQFIQEREDFLQRMDEMLTEADKEGTEQVDLAQARRVIEMLDPESDEEQIVGYLSRGFGVLPENLPPASQKISIKVFMKNVKAGVVKKAPKGSKRRNANGGGR